MPTASRPGATAPLVGGLYGVRLGSVFFGESMFSRERDASKAALAHLVEHCRHNGIVVIDCQLPSRHLRSLGSRPISRAQFLAWWAITHSARRCRC